MLFFYLIIDNVSLTFAVSPSLADNGSPSKNPKKLKILIKYKQF